MNLHELLQTMGATHFTVPESWHQGRTAYGGFSATMALAAARRAFDDLPPLRSAQFAFVAPVNGVVDAQAKLLRRGKNSAFIEVDLHGEEGLGLKGTLLFAHGRESSLLHSDIPVPPCLAPEDTAPRPHRARPKLFTGHLDYRPAALARAEGRPEVLRWVRLRERKGLEPATELLAIADALPPAGLALLPEPTPASSFNWTINLLDPAPGTRDGWWLVRSVATDLAGGIGSQIMTVWNREGRPVAQAMQSVAIFG